MTEPAWPGWIAEIPERGFRSRSGTIDGHEGLPVMGGQNRQLIPAATVRGSSFRLCAGSAPPAWVL